MIKYRLINGLGLVVSFMPAVIATLQYYPAIVEVTSSVWDRVGIGIIISAVFVMAVMVKYFSVKYPRPTPDVVFFVLWVVAEMLEKVIVPMSDILFWAALGAFVGGKIIAVSEFCEKRELRKTGISSGGE